MPEQLWETTMNPETRILKQLVVDDVAEANGTFSSLMGARVRLPTLPYLFILSGKKLRQHLIFLYLRLMSGKNS